MMLFLRGLFDRLFLVTAVVAGGLLPGFIAQYRQRVGGRLDQARLGTHLRALCRGGSVRTAVCPRGLVAVSRVVAAAWAGRAWLAWGDPRAAVAAGIPGRSCSAPDTASSRTRRPLLARP